MANGDLRKIRLPAIVINSYNDGPVEDGSIMGPFYEIETSSPGAELAPGASLVHTQKVIHIQGKDEQLAPIVQDLFGADLNVIKNKVSIG